MTFGETINGENGLGWSFHHRGVVAREHGETTGTEAGKSRKECF
jgi:hypothetical protein